MVTPKLFDRDIGVRLTTVRFSGLPLGIPGFHKGHLPIGPGPACLLKELPRFSIAIPGDRHLELFRVDEVLH
jgi:hypothetical protein